MGDKIARWINDDVPASEQRHWSLTRQVPANTALRVLKMRRMWGKSWGKTERRALTARRED